MEEIKVSVKETRISIEDSIKNLAEAEKSNKFFYATKEDFKHEWITNFIVSLEAPQITDEVRRARSSDIVFVFDVSGSMGEGNKLNDLKKVSKDIIKKLDGNINLGIIAFASSIYRELPLTNMSATGKQQAISFVEGLTPQDTTYMLSSMVKAKDWLLKSHGDSKCIIVQTDGDIFDNDDTDSFGSIKSTCQDNEIVIQSIALDSDMGSDNYDFMREYLCTRGEVLSAGRGQDFTLDEMLSRRFSKMSEIVAKNSKLCFEFAPMIGQQQSFKQYVKRIISTKDNSDITSRLQNNKVEIGSFVSGQKADFVVQIQHSPQSESAYNNGREKGVTMQNVCRVYVEYQDVTGTYIKTAPKFAAKAVYSQQSLCDSNSTDINEADRLTILATAELIRGENLKALANQSGATRKAAETEALQANEVISKYGSEEQKKKSEACSKAIQENNARAYNQYNGGSDSE